jgi:D-beta-D-heptose 7-phosphate kinase/D-beta-D-heptose 1-phosphate adenosyltransferase
MPPKSLAQGNVLVVGDVMLDRYWAGLTRRISPEAPVPVVKVSDETERVGGAANVAANVAALGASVALIGGVGDDDAGERLKQLCGALGIEIQFIRDASAKTIVKLRVMSQHQQLLRLDFEADEAAYAGEEIEAVFRSCLKTADVVVLSDYGKGMLCDSRSLIGIAREAGRPVIVDPKSDDYARYTGATLVTPNYTEFESCVGRCDNDAEIVSRARSLCERHAITALLITRGERGMILVHGDEQPLMLGADARDVFDVTGAGDTVCAALATGLAGGMGLGDAVRLANTAAGIAVGKSGTATVSLREITQAFAGPKGVSANGTILADQAIESVVRAARECGERIVMTNGCFDILHAGHVTYLNQAKALGSRLLVAVNSDASVARLKGAGRPVHKLADRLAVLAALGSVDWVVSFDADTPVELVARVSPDVLVKGGDYAVSDIVGGDHVLRTGGEVMTLPLTEGLSTSRVVAHLAGSAGADTP